MDYAAWIAMRVKQRRREYPAHADSDLFSLITPVYNTPPRYLRAMAASVFAQDFPWFEWIVIDNGSTAPGTRRVLDRLRRDPRVVLHRVEPNRGIMGGTRAAVERARNRYLVPVDSDDLLYPDALRVMADWLHAHDYPAVAYSDEDKALANGVRCHPFFKPDWDPVLFLNCCYVAHLCAIARAAAAAVEAYTDDAAHGCHDWDTFFRLLQAGHTPLHVPEVLYSWRMHDGSTAADNSSKPYTVDCQHYVLSNYLCSRDVADRVEMRVNPLFGKEGMWHPARRQVRPQPMQVLVLSTGRESGWRQVLHALAASSYPRLRVQVVGPSADGVAADLQAWNHMPGEPHLEVGWLCGNNLQSPAVRQYLAELPGEHLVAVVDEQLTPVTTDWPWEALGLFELHPETVIVGGRVFDATGRVLSAGEVFGMDGLLGCPDRQWHDGQPGYYGLFICQRTVDAVASGFFVSKAGFLRVAIVRLPNTCTPALLGGWLGAIARQLGRRVIYSPHIAAISQGNSQPVSYAAEERAAFLEAHGPLLSEARTYSRFLARESVRGYSLCEDPSQATPSRERIA
jgi:hypothetical protein